MTSNQAADTRCGYVALIGAPNAGKSTLLNALVGAKVAIVSPKAQTTRSRVLGIAIEGGSQILYVDTPGIFAPRRSLDEAMVRTAWSQADDADLIAVLMDASRERVGRDTWSILERLKEANRNAVLVLTQIDKVTPAKLLPRIAELNERFTFDATFMVSSVTGDGLDALKQEFAARVPAGPWLFPDDQLSDLPQRLLAAEVTREQLYHQLDHELPYASTVETEVWEEFENGSVKISQAITVERSSQKAIVLGKGGSRIKEIGAASRAELTRLLGRTVHLVLFVKVRENWSTDREYLETWGLKDR
ncbi:GTPase Era [Roseiterribacter gracilis]|uniref:GTPase Era n=1 Tax=Roseiterribacter gracilis TaxID=2812848 RepID=A0A8S8XBA8_9PROT|nr:GTPase Era [Rhodospirillales bacterium TMPK1]